MTNFDQALSRLIYSSRDHLVSIVGDAYRVMYDARPEHINNYSVAELVSWWVSHYRWSDNQQYWVPIVDDKEIS